MNLVPRAGKAAEDEQQRPMTNSTLQGHNVASLEFYTYEGLNEWGIPHAFFTRNGGVSPAPWQSLNFGGTVGDDLQHVRTNLSKAFRAVERELESRYEVWQVHSSVVVFANRPRKSEESLQQADAIVTDQPDVTLLMRFADCVPLLYYDPKKNIVGIAHAGWRGTVNGIAGEVIEAMQARYNSRPQDVIVAIGPSIGPDHYEVGVDVISQVRARFKARSRDLLKPVENEVDGKAYLDLWRANELILQDAGVKMVINAKVCTMCHTDEWYSHRGEAGRTGRFGVMVALPSKQNRV